MSTTEWVFLSVGLLGFAVLVISLLFGDNDAGGVDTPTGGDTHVDAGSDIDFDSPPWYSVTVIAAALAGFGICGFAMAHSGAPLVLSVGTSLVGLFGVGRLSYLLYRLVLRQQYDSQIGRDSYIGTEAHLILPVPKDGVGQVAFYDVNGIHTRLPARSDDGQALPSDMHVLIIDVTKDGAIVSPNPNYPLEG